MRTVLIQIPTILNQMFWSFLSSLLTKMVDLHLPIALSLEKVKMHHQHKEVVLQKLCIFLPNRTKYFIIPLGGFPLGAFRSSKFTGPR